MTDQLRDNRDRSHTADRVGAVIVRGAGHAPRPKNLKCPGGCKGSGWRYEEVEDVGDVRKACPECNPEGRAEEAPSNAPKLGHTKNLKCPGGCKGTGEVWVRVPKVGDRKAPCPTCRDPLEVKAGRDLLKAEHAAATGRAVETITTDDIGDIRAIGLGL